MLKRVLAVAALLCAGWAMATEGVSDMAVQLFGRESADKRVETGALFIDGLYVKGPYSVTREGNVILVNGKVASRLKVEARAKAEAERQAALAAERAKAAEEARQAAQDRETARRAERATPKARREIRGGLKEQLAQQKRDKAIQDASGQQGFNTEAAGGDPTALFEEADYTYTPPARPEPKAVPYIRPGAKQNLRQRIAARDERESAAKARQQAAEEDSDEAEEAVSEAFDDLTEAEIDAYSKQFAKRRADLEKILANDCLLLLSSQSSGASYKGRATMWRFVTQLGDLCAAGNANRLINAWGKEIPRAYLRRIYDNRAANSTEMEALIRRANEALEDARRRSERRI